MAIYFARIDGDPPEAPVKIGYARDPAQRLMTLQSSHYRDYVFIRVVEGGPADEKRIHRMFHGLRVRGEWFRYDPAMMGQIGLTDQPCPIAPFPTLRGGPMPDHHRKAISDGLRAAHYRKIVKSQLATTPQGVAVTQGG